MQQAGVGGGDGEGGGGGGGGGVGGGAHVIVGAGEQSLPVEEAMPISSRPPAAGNLDELMQDEDALAAAEGADRGDLGGGGGSSGNRWPKEETLALIKIRSEMDAAFRDANPKGPLWDEVSRKLAELGYHRSAKKCKEKFENVHKYYKRTKESRAGRQDGKTYKFFSELEALNATTPSSTTSATATTATPLTIHAPSPATTGFISFGSGPISSPMPISSIRIGAVPHSIVAPPPATANFRGISFSSDTPSSSPSSEDEETEKDEEEEVMEGTSRKRKRLASPNKVRGESYGGKTKRLMRFLENLLKQVLEKQEEMQKRLLEAMERREKERSAREDAWRREEKEKVTKELELMAQERAMAAQREAAMIAFLQKITGQTVPIPPYTTVVPVTVVSQPPPLQPQQEQQENQLGTEAIVERQKSTTLPFVTSVLPSPSPLPQPQHHYHQPFSASTEVVMAVPEQQVGPHESSGGNGGTSSFEPGSSRWPKEEVLALINLRTRLEPRYQEAGPKGPLWEEISAGMARLGYKRSPKRCKEKWENINKYYKKMKESNKKRPEDAKTCPYYHQLDVLYSQKLLGSSGSGSGQNRPQQRGVNFAEMSTEKAQDAAPIVQATQQTQDMNLEITAGSNANVQESSSGLQRSLFGETSDAAAKKPEDIMTLMEQQQQRLEDHQQQPQQLTVDDYHKMVENDSDGLNEEEYEEEDEGDEVVEDEAKMAYNMECQRQSAGTPNGGNGTPSFLTMVK